MTELRSFFESINEHTTRDEYNKIKNELLTLEEWTDVEKLLSILKPFNKYTLKLQSELCTLSDFFGYWISIKLAMNKFERIELVDLIIEEMKKREKTLLDNPLVVAAVYLDPRFQRILNENQKTNAVFFLKGLFNKLKRNKEKNYGEAPVQLEQSKEQNSWEDLALYLENLEDCSITETVQENETNIDQILKNFDGTKAAVNISILDYWKNNKELHPELNELASIVYTVPPTQSSVERSFSTLAIVLTSRRNRLSDGNLQNILMCKLNSNKFISS